MWEIFWNVEKDEEEIFRNTIPNFSYRANQLNIIVFAVLSDFATVIVNMHNFNTSLTALRLISKVDLAIKIAPKCYMYLTFGVHFITFLFIYVVKLVLIEIISTTILKNEEKYETTIYTIYLHQR